MDRQEAFRPPSRGLLSGSSGNVGDSPDILPVPGRWPSQSAVWASHPETETESFSPRGVQLGTRRSDVRWFRYRRRLTQLDYRTLVVQRVTEWSVFSLRHKLTR